MSFDPGQLSVETQRRVFLTVLRALAQMERPAHLQQEAPLVALGATIDGLLEVAASLLVETGVLPSEAIERQVCDDLRDALIGHIRRGKAEAAAALETVRH